MHVNEALNMRQHAAVKKTQRPMLHHPLTLDNLFKAHVLCVWPRGAEPPAPLCFKTNNGSKISLVWVAGHTHSCTHRFTLFPDANNLARRGCGPQWEWEAIIEHPVKSTLLFFFSSHTITEGYWIFFIKVKRQAQGEGGKYGKSRKTAYTSIVLLTQSNQGEASQ